MFAPAFILIFLWRSFSLSSILLLFLISSCHLRGQLHLFDATLRSKFVVFGFLPRRPAHDHGVWQLGFSPSFWAWDHGGDGSRSLEHRSPSSAPNSPLWTPSQKWGTAAEASMPSAGGVGNGPPGWFLPARGAGGLCDSVWSSRSLPVSSVVPRSP